MSTLFKYMSSPRTLFEDGFIRASQLSVLNDPFEATYCEESLNDLVSYFDDSLVFDSGNGNISFSEYIDKHMHRIGVISLTESKDNLLMWAHYASEHHGIVAGLNPLSIVNGMFVNLVCPSLLFSTSWEGFGPFDGIPKPVMYRKQPRYRLDRFDYDYSNISAEGADRILFEVFMQKSEEWIYEKEHRIVLRLEQADRARIFDIDQLENEHVKKTILGSNWCTFNQDDGYHDIDLMNIEEQIQREVVAKFLAALSRNKKNVYLFKLKPNALTHCLLGLKCELKKSDVIKEYANSVGYFEVWSASKNKLSYSLEFNQI